MINIDPKRFEEAKESHEWFKALFDRPLQVIKTKKVEKTCPECNFVLSGQYEKWRKCPSCHLNFEPYDAFVN